MVNVNTYQIQQVIHILSNQFEIEKHNREYELSKMVMTDLEPSRWRVWFKPITHYPEGAIVEEFGVFYEKFYIVPKKLKVFRKLANYEGVINFCQIDRAIDIMVKFMLEFAGLLSVNLEAVFNRSYDYIDIWDFYFGCMNEEKERIFVGIRVNVETQEVTVLEVINKGGNLDK